LTTPGERREGGYGWRSVQRAIFFLVKCAEKAEEVGVGEAVVRGIVRKAAPRRGEW